MFSERNRNRNEVSYFSGVLVYLTIIPGARMGSESIAHEAEGRMGTEAMRARGIIVLVKSKLLVKNIENKKNLAS